MAPRAAFLADHFEAPVARRHTHIPITDSAHKRLPFFPIEIEEVDGRWNLRRGYNEEALGRKPQGFS